jgi:hypothetical protein
MIDDSFFAPPPFDASAALQGLRRSLRDLRMLTERGDEYLLRGRTVIVVRNEGAALQARVARQPAVVPQWDERILRSSPDVRQFLDEVKKRLARWSDE